LPSKPGEEATFNLPLAFIYHSLSHWSKKQADSDRPTERIQKNLLFLGLWESTQFETTAHPPGTQELASCSQGIFPVGGFWPIREKSGSYEDQHPFA
jgi:hypothetical protein